MTELNLCCPYKTELTFIILARPTSEATPGSGVSLFSAERMIGDVNLFLKGGSGSSGGGDCDDDDDAEAEAEVEIMIAGALFPLIVATSTAVRAAALP